MSSLSQPSLVFLCFSLSCRHMTATTTEAAVASVVTVPEATLVCHPAIWQSVASFLSFSSSHLNSSHLPSQLLLSLSKLIDTWARQEVNLAAMHVGPSWWIAYNCVWLMQWMGVYIWQPFSVVLTFFFSSFFCLTLCTVPVPLVYFR